jgi:hypothetical protein
MGIARSFACSVVPELVDDTNLREMTKSAVVAQLVRIARKARLGYDDFLYISQQARKKLACAGDAKSAGCLSCLPTPT